MEKKADIHSLKQKRVSTGEKYDHRQIASDSGFHLDNKDLDSKGLNHAEGLNFSCRIWADAHLLARAPKHGSIERPTMVLTADGTLILIYSLILIYFQMGVTRTHDRPFLGCSRPRLKPIRGLRDISGRLKKAQARW